MEINTFLWSSHGGIYCGSNRDKKLKNWQIEKSDMHVILQNKARRVHKVVFLQQEHLKGL